MNLPMQQEAVMIIKSRENKKDRQILTQRRNKMMLTALRIIVVAYLSFEAMFFMFHAWKVRENRYHLLGNAISGIFSMLAILLIWR